MHPNIRWSKYKNINYIQNLAIKDEEYEIAEENIKFSPFVVPRVNCGEKISPLYA